MFDPSVTGTQLAPEGSYAIASSPVGNLTLVKRGKDLVGLFFPGHRPAPRLSRLGAEAPGGFGEVETQLVEYFAGIRRHFDVPYVAEGTPALERVWALVSAIPYGQTSTYGRLAYELGDGTTAQEVGGALARNPLCIVIPCHRIVGADGGLTGYAGGIGRKRFLLDLEQRVAGCSGRLF
jgi:methylated-DNA-[protein]-cysteine S-methyltransferase